MDSLAFYRDLWDLPAYFACNINSSNKADLDDHWISARDWLVCDPSAADPLLRSRGRISVPKDAQSDLMAVSPRLDLDPAGLLTGWRRPVR